MSAAGLPLFVVETVVYTYAAMDLLSFIIIMGRGYRRTIKKNKRVTDIGHPRCQGMNKKMCIGLWELCCLNIQQRKLQSTGS